MTSRDAAAGNASDRHFWAVPFFMLYLVVLAGCVGKTRFHLPATQPLTQAYSTHALENFQSYLDAERSFEATGTIKVQYKDWAFNLDQATQVIGTRHYNMLLLDDFGNALAQAVSHFDLEPSKTVLATQSHNDWACRIKLPLAAGEMAAILAGVLPQTRAWKILGQNAQGILVESPPYAALIDPHGKPLKYWRHGKNQEAFEISLADFKRTSNIEVPTHIVIAYPYGKIEVNWKNIHFR